MEGFFFLHHENVSYKWWLKIKQRFETVKGQGQHNCRCSARTKKQNNTTDGKISREGGPKTEQSVQTDDIRTW